MESLDKNHMREIKSYDRPPGPVETVMKAVMILQCREPTWAEAKRHLGKDSNRDESNWDKLKCSKNRTACVQLQKGKERCKWKDRKDVPSVIPLVKFNLGLIPNCD